MVQEDYKNNTIEDPFKSAKRLSAVEYVVNTIKDALIENKLQPGEKIPSELELSKRLSISRGSIREAMKILSAFGIVDIRRGEGTFIVRSGNKAMLDPLLFSFILSKPKMKEIVELRELIEINIVQLIVKNADQEDLERINNDIKTMEKSIKENGMDNLDDLVQCDLAFHRSLGKASKNRLIEKIYDFILDFYSPSFKTIYKNKEIGLLGLKDHKRIYSALVKRDLQESIKLIKKSVEEWKHLVISSTEQS